MASTPGHVGNPLTLIAIFAGLSETVSAAALPFIEGGAQDRLIWFVTLFPCALVALFFITLWASPQKLYGPGDFKSDEGYLAAQRTLTVTEVLAPPSDAAEKLRGFWQQQGRVNDANAAKLQGWMAQNNIGIASIATFLAAKDYEADRKRAVADFSL